MGRAISKAARMCCHVLPACLPACVSKSHDTVSHTQPAQAGRLAACLPVCLATPRPPPCPAPLPCLPASLDAVEALAQQGGQHQQVVVVDPHKILL
jgi:hypothetical protein